jgi:hypothetical protein
MPKLIARKMNSDGKYRYGLSTTAAPEMGPLYGITVNGGAIIPPPGARAGAGASQAEHDAWIGDLKASGAQVDVVPIPEPKP